MWVYLGSGSYNHVYHNADSTLILKVQREKNPLKMSSDKPERSVRLWNEINPDLPSASIIEATVDIPDFKDAKNTLWTTKTVQGWTCPFVEGVQASDVEISVALIMLFNRTGKIVIDAPVAGNFKKTPQGKIVCLDVGYALQLGQIERAPSLTSLENWQRASKRYEEPQTSYERFYGKSHGFFYEAEFLWTHRFPQTIATIKSLLFIREIYPWVTDVSFLTPDLTAMLSELSNEKPRDAKKINTMWGHLNIGMITQSHSPIAQWETEQRQSNYLYAIEHWDFKNDLLKNVNQPDNPVALQSLNDYIDRHKDIPMDDEIELAILNKRRLIHLVMAIEAIKINFYDCLTIDQAAQLKRNSIQSIEIPNCFKLINMAEASAHELQHADELKDVIKSKQYDINTKFKDAKRVFEREMAQQFLDKSNFPAQLETINQLQKELGQRALLDPHYIDARDTAKILFNRIKDIAWCFVNYGESTSYLKQKSINALSESMEVLGQHRGYKPIIENIINFFASLLSLGIANYATGRWRLFSFPTRSAEIVRVVSQAIENLENHPSP